MAFSPLYVDFNSFNRLVDRPRWRLTFHYSLHKVLQLKKSVNFEISQQYNSI